MVERLDTLTMPGGTAFRITQDARESGGERFEMEVTLPPGGPSPPKHFHPDHEEEQEVLAGTLSVYLDGAWRELRAGESLMIARGRVHTLRNDSSETVRFRDAHVPASSFQDYIEELHRLAQAGRIKEGMGPSTLLYGSMLLRRHRDTQVSASSAQRAGESFLALIGRLLRLRAG